MIFLPKSSKKPQKEFVQEYLYIEDQDVELDRKKVKKSESEETNRGVCIIELW